MNLLAYLAYARKAVATGVGVTFGTAVTEGFSPDHGIARPAWAWAVALGLLAALGIYNTSNGPKPPTPTK